MCCRSVGCRPPMTLGTPVEGFGVMDFGGRSPGRRWSAAPRWSIVAVASSTVVAIVPWRLTIVIAAMRRLAVSVVFRAIASPVSRFTTLVAVSWLGLRCTRRCGLGLDQGHDFSSSQRIITVDSQVSKTGRWGLGVSHVLCWRPLFAIVECAVSVLSVATDVLIRELLLKHMPVCCGFFLVTNCKQSLVQFLFDPSEWVLEVFVTRSAGLKENLEHGKGEIVVILTSCCQFPGVPPEVGCELLQVFTGVLRWMPLLDCLLDIFKPFN